jgi:hypothetical protein
MTAPSKVAAFVVSAVLGLTLAASAAASSRPSGPVRVTADRPGTSGLRVHLVYLVSKGHKDRHYDTDGTLARAAGQLQSWFKRETGGRELKLDTYVRNGKRVPDISFVRSSRTSFVCESRNDGSVESVLDQHCVTEIATDRASGTPNKPADYVQADLAAAGLKDPSTRYLVLVEGTAGIICGYGQGPDDTDSDPAHVGRVAAIFLGDSLCPDDDPGAGEQVTWEMAHEFLHGDGAVPIGAPHTCLGATGHVCTAALGMGSPATDKFDPERADVMYPSPGINLTDAHIDPGHDDYYGTAVGLRDVADSPYLTAKR